MDEFFESDLAMLGEEEGDFVGEFADPSEISNGVDNISIYQKALDKLQVCGFSEDMQFQLVSDAISLSVYIEAKIVDEYNFIRDCYRLKFPELESLVHHPLDYVRLVKIMSIETDDMTRLSSHLNEAGFLSPAMVMVISVTASTTTGTPPLPQEEVLARTLEACDRAIELDSVRLKILDFVESRMLDIAPNISALAGSAIAAKLISAAGSLEELAKTPACNVLLLGAPKNTNLAGFSSEPLRVGYIDQTEVFSQYTPSLRGCVSRALAAKLSLAARVDFVRGDSTGQIGKKFLEEIRKKIDKLQEPAIAKIQKSLPVPGSRKKKKRGGKRLRNTKERYRLTKQKQLANRVKFNVPEESSLGDGFE